MVSVSDDVKPHIFRVKNPSIFVKTAEMNWKNTEITLEKSIIRNACRIGKLFQYYWSVFSKLLFDYFFLLVLTGLRLCFIDVSRTLLNMFPSIKDVFTVIFRITTFFTFNPSDKNIYIRKGTLNRRFQKGYFKGIVIVYQRKPLTVNFWG